MQKISKKQAPKQKAEKLSVEQVEHIAKLARIELTDQEKEKFSKELSSILDYVGQLKKVNTKNIELIKQITGLENVDREDESGVKNQELRKKILEQAPRRKEDYFQVPRILE